jgi:hypothetical protein
MPRARAASHNHRILKGTLVAALPKRTFVIASALLIAFAASFSPALAKSPGSIQPQPEMNAFTVSNASADSGSGQVLPDGTLVVASIANSRTKINVCTMHPGDRSCATTWNLNSYHNSSNTDSFYDTPEVLSTGGKDVSIIAEDCCYIPPFNGGAVIFNSTNDGRTFGSEISAGNAPGINTATVANGQLVVANGPSSTFHVQALPPVPTTPVSTDATPNNREVGDSSITTYDGGILVASDDIHGNTVVEYAKSGSNYNDSSSYKSVAIINKEDLSGLAGNALLTDPGGSLTGGERIRFFNGSSFGTWHKVPEPTGGDDGSFTLAETPKTTSKDAPAGSLVHIFFENRRHSYDVYSETTTNGVDWSPLSIYNPSAFSDELVPVLNPLGSGICYETDGSVVRAQPLMLPQTVNVKLNQTHVTTGHSTILVGTDSVHLTNDKLTLEQLQGSSWKTFASKPESTSTSSSGGVKFQFTIPGYTHSYRVVVNDDPGYFQFGYSNVVSLTAHHPDLG